MKELNNQALMYFEVEGYIEGDIVDFSHRNMVKKNNEHTGIIVLKKNECKNPVPVIVFVQRVDEKYFYDSCDNERERENTRKRLEELVKDL